jgi:hypothetical protein
MLYLKLISNGSHFRILQARHLALSKLSSLTTQVLLAAVQPASTSVLILPTYSFWLVIPVPGFQVNVAEVTESLETDKPVGAAAVQLLPLLPPSPQVHLLIFEIITSTKLSGKSSKF